ncbi:hypothetical protein QTH97_08790 [Variovorax sp. J22R24]|uniref:hypothetical protein n=1 Tax=Variovorax gracilis TaxID=3053502 RepID=UPI0025769B98|nr:hypothetical protein [Variovorax sp. J22R24]MDM0105027.1 hypothetical protein [Variovorax sp. J22R24]
MARPARTKNTPYVPVATWPAEVLHSSFDGPRECSTLEAPRARSAKERGFPNPSSKESSMHATTANSIWPAKWPATVQAVGYAQVGDLFKMLVQHKESDFAACEFCRTMNSLGAVRCATCGGHLSPSSDEAPSPEPAKPAKASSPDARALRSVLTMVLVPPLLLFVSFATWHQLQFENHETAAASAKPSSSLAAAATTSPVAVTSAQQKIVSDLLASKKIASGHEEVSSTSWVAPPAVQARAAEPEDSSRASSPGSHGPSHTTRSAPPRSRDVAAAPVRQRSDLLAACSGRSFLARAVCVNNRCAEPGAARLGQCREALRQRRIDEARRNPMLMG